MRRGKLMATMTANAEILLEERKGVLAIPEGAIIYGKDRIHPGGDPRRRHRDRAAPRDGGHRASATGRARQIISGLREGQQVILQ